MAATEQWIDLDQFEQVAPGTLDFLFELYTSSQHPVLGGSTCGIVTYNLARARALKLGISEEKLPPAYEEIWGDPEDACPLSEKQALDFLEELGSVI